MIATALLFLSACRRHEPQQSTLPPRDANVLLITLDTVRADHLSCYAPGHARTPNLDALAARGARFKHATVQVPLTIPSHACIMTGTYPPVNRVRGMDGFVLDKSHPTIASLTQAAGFATAAFVGSTVLDRRFGFSNGFTTYNDNMGKGIVEGGLPGVFPEVRASVVTDRAIAWLRSNGNKKFFLWCHYYDAHAPYWPPEPYRRLYAHDLYSGEIAYTDSQVGRLFDFLKGQNVLGRTLIVVTADHGESLGEHGEATHGIFLYDSTLHVPLIIAGPGIPAGKVIAEQARSIDILPTIMEFLRLKCPSEAQGVSLWPVMQHGTPVRSNYSYSETIYPRTTMGW
ncbi:MAG: sulfatase, partial [Terriglobia bacterium]